MPGVYHKIVHAQEAIGAHRSAELFSRMFVSEALMARKPNQNEVVVDTISAAVLAGDVGGLSEAHERSSGDAEIIALDAASVAAYANYRLSIVASYDFFDDVERVAQSAQSSPDMLRTRIHNALCRAQKVIVIEGPASRMGWLYLDRPWIVLPSPPLPAFSNPARDMSKPILIVVHRSDSTAQKTAASVHAKHANSIVVDSTVHGTGADIPTSVSLVVHIGRDARARGGLRVVDCWASEVPVVQLIPRMADAGADEEGASLPSTTVTHNETGLVANNATELGRHVTTLMNDPILVATLTRRAKIEVARHTQVWREIVARTFS